MTNIMQETSLQAYTEVQPTLPESRRQVYQEIKRHSSQNRINGHWAKAVTNMELAFLLGWSINRVTPRTNELMKAGLVTEALKRNCRMTGARSIAWRAQP